MAVRNYDYKKSARIQIFRLCSLLFIHNIFAFQLSAEVLPGLSYVNPFPGSKGNHVSTNVILDFKRELKKGIDLKSFIQVTTSEEEIPFLVSIQKDYKKVILEFPNPMPANARIDVSAINEIPLMNGSHNPLFHFSFFTDKRTRYSVPQDVEIEALRKQAMKQPIMGADGGSGNNRTILTDLNYQIPFYMSITQNQPGEYFFLGSMFSPGARDRAMIVNTKGEIIFDKRTPFMPLDFKMHEDTTFSFAFLANDPDDITFRVLDKNFRDKDTVKAGNGYITDIHELIRDPKTGNYFLLAQRVIDVNMNSIVAFGKPDAKVLDLIIQEVNQAGQVLFEWKCFDHLPILDAVGVDLSSSGPIDFIHCNGIMLDTDTTLLLSSRHLCEVTRIDRRSGDIIWRLGPNASTHAFRFLNDPDGFTYQHHAQRLPNGHILLFDNGNFKQGPRFSRAVEYKLNEDSMTAEMVWQYRHNPDVVSDFMGSVQRLPNGNTVIGWGSANPTLTEVDSNNEVINEGSFPYSILNYRVFKYNIPGIITPLQPKLTMPDNYEACKLRDPDFDNKFLSDIRDFAPDNISPDFQNIIVNNNKVKVVMEDTLSNFFSFDERNVIYRNVNIGMKDTIVCSGPGLIDISMNDGCQNSSYQWNIGKNEKKISYQTSENLNKLWVTTRNGKMVQTDTLRITVSPLKEIDIIGETVFTKPYQIYTYSVPYVKSAKYDWKAMNGNVVSGFETNCIQVQWGNKPQSFLLATLTDPYGCQKASPWDTVQFQQTTTGMEDLNELTGIQVYPSPFHNQLALKGKQSFEYRIFNEEGKLVVSSALQENGSGSIDTESWANGMYIAEFTTPERVVRVKLLKD